MKNSETSRGYEVELTGEAMEHIGLPVGVGDSVGTDVLRKPVQVGVFGHVILELDDEGALVCFAGVFGDGDEGSGGSTENGCS